MDALAPAHQLHRRAPHRARERQARALAPLLAGRRISKVLVSPSQRALRTAALAGLADWTEDADLREWNYGGYEGVTTAEIHRARPDRNLWTEGTPATPHGRPGESPGTVAARADRVLVRVAESLRAADSADVVLVAHGHLLRVLTARYLGLPPAAGGPVHPGHRSAVQDGQRARPAGADGLERHGRVDRSERARLVATGCG